MKKAILIIGILLLIFFVGCAPRQAPISVPVPPAPTPQQEAPSIVPEPKTWDKITLEEHNKALEACYSLLRSRLMGLATSQDAIDFVNSFLDRCSTSQLNANGDKGDKEGTYVHCPDNAWWLKWYGMFRTGETQEMEIEGQIVTMEGFHTPERWQDAVWLIYIDGRVEPFHNEFSSYPDSAFNVEEDILKLNRGLQLDYEWRR